MYVTLPDIGLATPALQLRGFAKAKDIAPGATTHVSVSLDKYAVSFWDTPKNAWTVQPGTYGVAVGRSSSDILLLGVFVLESGFEWAGL